MAKITQKLKQRDDAHAVEITGNEAKMLAANEEIIRLKHGNNKLAEANQKLKLDGKGSAATASHAHEAKISEKQTIWGIR